METSLQISLVLSTLVNRTPNTCNYINPQIDTLVNDTQIDKIISRPHLKNNLKSG